jgi:DNA-directed RNA polymerase subunit RPC12/RpoP
MAIFLICRAASVLMPTIRFFCVICGTALRGTSDALENVIECHGCARHVPVPKPVDVATRGTGCTHAFPTEVLALEVKFLCTACRSPLRADARWEGRSVVCPVCGNKAAVPRWSNAPRWPRPDEAAPASATAVALSPEEIEFLSTPGSGAMS